MPAGKPTGPLVISALFVLLWGTPAVSDVPEPAEALGFEPGEDFHLAPWEEVVAYVDAIDDASNRIAVERIGTSTQGRPILAAIVSSAETIADLDTYRERQRRLADPTYKPVASEAEAAALVEQSKTTVLMTCSIHSSETASTLMACELLHELATRDDPQTRAILENTILLLIPSVNPDGVTIVHDWYERSKGTPWEGSGLPWLYHPYAGHDTNRDWFMLNLEETRAVTRFLYDRWFPTITWDVHQMGSRGPRLFVPPFHDPVNPNLDPRVSQGIFLIGAHLAADLAKAGKRGVATNVIYDNWWNGGCRTVPQRHNMVGILTEAASVKLATPIFLDASDLRGGGRGFRDHEPSVTFVDPWPGGWWRLSDIIEYEQICARSLLNLAARYKDWFQSSYREMALDQIEWGETEPPFAWVVPADQRDPGTAAKLIEILHTTGIVVERAVQPFEAGGASFPEGSWVLRAAQPYRAYLKDVMERQNYPDRVGPDGRPERPYDVAGWTLPLQMGVEAATIADPFEAETEVIETIELGGGRTEGNADQADAFVLSNQANDDFIVLNALQEAGAPIDLVTEEIRLEDRTIAAGSLHVPASSTARETLEATLPEVSSVAVALEEPLPSKSLRRLPPRRIGLYQPWRPSMDEGWTRFVLESFAFPYETLHNADIKAGNLNERLDVIILPSIGRRTITQGYRPEQTEPKYVGGLAGEGEAALRRFVEQGGALVCLEDSCHWAIRELELPVQDALSGVSSDEFFCPGSIVGVRYERGEADRLSLALGMPAEGSAYFARSLAFEVDEEASDRVRIPCRYAETGVLQSGWILGPDYLESRPAVVEVAQGAGRVVLFGFPPQHRGQPHGTFRPFFNALIGPGDGDDSSESEGGD